MLWHEEAKARSSSGEDQDSVLSQLHRCPPKTHKTIVRSLGLRKLNQIVERPDTDSMRGAVAKIPHLLRIVD